MRVYYGPPPQQTHITNLLPLFNLSLLLLLLLPLTSLQAFISSLNPSEVKKKNTHKKNFPSPFTFHLLSFLSPSTSSYPLPKFSSTSSFSLIAAGPFIASLSPGEVKKNKQKERSTSSQPSLPHPNLPQTAILRLNLVSAQLLGCAWVEIITNDTRGPKWQIPQCHRPRLPQSPWMIASLPIRDSGQNTTLLAIVLPLL